MHLITADTRGRGKPLLTDSEWGRQLIKSNSKEMLPVNSSTFVKRDPGQIKSTDLDGFHGVVLVQFVDVVGDAGVERRG